MSATVALAGLAAKIGAPPFPGDSAEPEAVQEWILGVIRRVGERLNDPRLVYRADARQRQEWAKRFGFFWTPCPICGEPFSGAEWSPATPSLYKTPTTGDMVCPKPDCAVESARRNRENGFLTNSHTH